MNDIFLDIIIHRLVNADRAHNNTPVKQANLTVNLLKFPIPTLPHIWQSSLKVLLLSQHHDRQSPLLMQV